MKNIFIKITAMLIAVISVCSLVGCDGGDGDDEDAYKIPDAPEAVDVYKVEPLEIAEQIGETVTDGKFNYFYFKLGTIKNVPVYYDNAYRHNGLLSATYEWKTVKSYEDAYSSTIEDSVKKSTTETDTVSLTSSVTAKAEASYSGVSASVEASVEKGLSETLSIENSEELTKSFTTTISSTREECKSRKVIIEKSAPAGYYRYTVYAKAVDVYVAMICNIEAKTATYKYISIPRATGFFDEFAYSKENDFDEKEAATKLAFTEDMLLLIDTDDPFSPNVKKKTADYVYTTLNALDDRTKRTIEDKNDSYGMAHMNEGEKIEITDIKQYLTADYKLRFNVSIEFESGYGFFGKVKGYREAYLYNEHWPPTEEPHDEAMAKEKGMIAGHVWTRDYGKESFTWEATGDNFSKFAEDDNVYVYIIYDAYGDGEDTWIKKAIKVTIDVLPA